jgi:hypothetical protein
MNGSLSIDHVVLVVIDLPTSTRHFEALGFTVTPGGVHAGGLTHNALIGLADGTYLELVAATRRPVAHLLKLIKLIGAWQLYPPTRNPMGRRFLGLIAHGPGLGDYALLSPDLENSLNEIRARGFELESPLPGSRMRPDNQQVSWRTAVPSTNDLPFLIEDVTPHDLRLPPDTACKHANQATGIAGITVMIADLEHSAAGYATLLGLEATTVVPVPSKGIRSVSFPVGKNAAITLTESSDSVVGSHQYLASRPGRPLKIELSTAKGDLLTLSHDPIRDYSLSALT